MAIDPKDIRLSQADMQALAELADESRKSGKELSTALREAVNAYLEDPSKSSEANGARKSVEARKEAFRRAAGAWKDMDTDAMIEEIYALRLRPSRPAPEL